MAGEACGEEAYSHVTISRFLRGDGTTKEVATALAQVTGIPLPSQDLEEPWATWMRIGRELHALSPEIFQSELYEGQRLVEALRRRVERQR